MVLLKLWLLFPEFAAAPSYPSIHIIIVKHFLFNSTQSVCMCNCHMSLLYSLRLSNVKFIAIRYLDWDFVWLKPTSFDFYSNYSLRQQFTLPAPARQLLLEVYEHVRPQPEKPCTQRSVQYVAIYLFKLAGRSVFDFRIKCIFGVLNLV
jgi:hypothetical protein